MHATEDHPIVSAFKQALAAAREFEGATAPNPPVGCAILDDTGHLLACEAHRRAGEAHAEARAIDRCRMLGVAHRIHTVVVTLEPCAHEGRTPPCTDALLGTPARQVWIGTPDPNPGVTGGGARRLAQAGLEVSAIADLDHAEAAMLHAQAARLIAPFAKRVGSGLPWITVKQAVDAAGGMVPPPGLKTFTGPDALVVAHRLRRRADAIVTGSGTVLADEPFFTVRHVEDVPGKRRALVVLDRRGRVPGGYLDAARARGFDARVARSLPEALGTLAAEGALEVLVEAGAQVTAHVLAELPWDEHIRIAVGADGHERIERRLPDGTVDIADARGWVG